MGVAHHFVHNATIKKQFRSEAHVAPHTRRPRCLANPRSRLLRCNSCHALRLETILPARHVPTAGVDRPGATPRLTGHNARDALGILGV
eukprot:COSAG02_NODE_97_length_37159_cov_37.660335_30_plen_89_part_00